MNRGFFLLMIERKCLKCNTWNKDEDFCVNCGEPLSPKEIEKAEAIARKEKAAKEYKPDKLDIIQEKAKNSKYLLVRVAYKIGYSIGLVVMAIGSFFAWLVAWAAA